MPRWKLRVEMVPEPLWQMNLRSSDALGRYRWDKLRKSMIVKRGPACAICGTTERPHGHEIWKYEDRRRISIARLVGIEIICGDCHAVHHWGLTTRLTLLGIMTREEFKRLVRHVCKVNRCKARAFKRHADEAYAIWEERSDRKWRIDWGDFREAIRDAKAARVEREMEAEKRDREKRKTAAKVERNYVLGGGRHVDFDGDGPPEAWSKSERR